MQHPDLARVILTNIDTDGASNFEILSQKADTQLDGNGYPVFINTDLWGTPDGFQQVGPNTNIDQVTIPFFPGPGGVRFRFFTFMPDPPKHKNTAESGRALLENATGDGLSNFADAFDPNRPGMHISDSVDYVFVVSGEVVLELERREILVKEGDVVVLKGGWHNWRNETDRPCTVASVMVGADRRNS